jgi:putative ABC transport system permease protein
MIKLLRLATRNLGRNRRRSLLTGAAIALGLAMMLFTIGIQTFSYNDIITKGVSNLAGHVVVQAKGAQDDETLLMSGTDAIADTLRATFPDELIVRRMLLGGLLNAPSSASAIVLNAVEPGVEAKASELADKVVEGEWLAEDDDRGVILGIELARNLDVEVGDKVVWMGQPEGQDLTSRMLRVRGLASTGAPSMDAMLAITTIATAQKLVGDATAASQVTVHLRNAEDTSQATAKARAALSQPDIEILTWKEALPQIWEWTEIDRQAGDFILAIIGFIVALGVVNTMTMSVLERTRELGVLLALGMRQGQLARMVLLESFVLGAISIGVGVALGLGIIYLVATYGIDLSGTMGGTESYEVSGVAATTTLRAKAHWGRILTYAVCGLALSLLTAAWPAWWVSRLKPVEALRHN